MTEHDHQRILVAWFRANYPDMILFAIPNGGTRDTITAKRLKREGVLAGVPDLFLATPRQGKSGLFLEMKSATGRPTAAQHAMITRLRSFGYECRVCWGYEEAKVAVVEYLATAPLSVSKLLEDMSE